MLRSIFYFINFKLHILRRDTEIIKKIDWKEYVMVFFIYITLTAIVLGILKKKIKIFLKIIPKLFVIWKDLNSHLLFTLLLIIL